MSNAAQRLDDGLAHCQSLIEQIRSDIAKMDNFLPSQRTQLDAQVDQRMADFDTRLTNMFTLMRRIPTNSKDYFQSELDSLRSLHSELMTEIERKRAAAARDPRVQRNEADLATARRAQAASGDLDEALRLGRQNVKAQSTMMETLLEDRDMLSDIDGNLNSVDREAQKGRSTAKRMQRRTCLMSYLGWVVFGLLIAIMVMEIALKLKGVWP
jgi:hypothetical protein